MKNTLLASPPKQRSEDPSLVAVVTSLVAAWHQERGGFLYHQSPTFTTWSGPMRQPVNILGALILKKVHCIVTRLPYFVSASSFILREEAEGGFLCAHFLTSLLSPCRGTCNVTLMWLRHKHDNKIHRNAGSYTIRWVVFSHAVLTMTTRLFNCRWLIRETDKICATFLVTSPAYQLFSNCKACKEPVALTWCKIALDCSLCLSGNCRVHPVCTLPQLFGSLKSTVPYQNHLSEMHMTSFGKEK